MSNESQSKWTWDGASPLAQVVVSAFGDRLGDPTQGDLDVASFVRAATESFPALSEGDARGALRFFGPDGVRNAIMNQLSGADPTTTADLADELGRLAGSTPRSHGLVVELRETFEGGRTYDVSDPLRNLATLAVNNLAQVTEIP